MGNAHGKGESKLDPEALADTFVLIEENDDNVIKFVDPDVPQDMQDITVRVTIHEAVLIKNAPHIATITLLSTDDEEVGSLRSGKVHGYQPKFAKTFLFRTRRDCRSGIKITIESRETNPIVYSCVIRFSDAHEYLCGGVKSIVPLEIVKGETSHYRQIHGYYFATASPSVHATVGITRITTESLDNVEVLDTPESVVDSPTPYIDISSSEVAIKLQLVNRGSTGTYVITPASKSQDVLLVWILTKDKTVDAHAIRLDPKTKLYTFKHPTTGTITGFHSLYNLLTHHNELFKQPLHSHGPAPSSASNTAPQVPVKPPHENPHAVTSKPIIAPPIRVVVPASALDIFHAARVGDLIAVKDYVQKRKVDVNQLDEYGNPAIYYAVLCGHASVVEYLLDKGAEVDLSTPLGNRMLLAAMTNEIRLTLRRRAKFVNTTENNQIMGLAFKGKVKHLEKHAAHVNFVDKSGLKPIDVATLNEQHEACELLSKLGAYGTIVSDFAKLVNNEALADVKFIAQGGTLYAHRVILLLRLPVELWQIILCLDDAAVELLKEENFGRNASVLEIEVGERSPLRKYSSLLAFMKHVYYGTYRVTDDDVWPDLVEVSKLPGVIDHLPVLASALEFHESTLTWTRMKLDDNISQVLERAINNKLYSDITLVVEGREIFAHRAILYARSEYFAALLKGGMRETIDGRVVIENMHYDAVHTMLEFIYLNRLMHPEFFTPQDALEILGTSSMWFLSGLKDYCEEILCTQSCFEISDAIDLYLYSEECNAGKLKKVILQAMMNNPGPVLDNPNVKHLPEECIDLLDRAARRAKSFFNY